MIKYIKTRNVKSPTRANPTDAGIDFYIPFCDEKFITDFNLKNSSQRTYISNSLGSEYEVVIEGHARCLIPSGIKVCFEDNSALVAANKSGVSTKHGLTFTAQVVDSSYSGEVHIGVVNTGNNEVRIKCGNKLIQFLHVPVMCDVLEEISEEEFNEFHKDSTRGATGFGQSGE